VSFVLSGAWPPALLPGETLMTSREAVLNIRCRFTWKTILAALLFVFASWFMRGMFNMSERLALLGFLLAVAAFLVFPRPTSWLYLLPFIFFVAGAQRISLGEFHPTSASVAMFLFTFWYLADRIVWNEKAFVPSKMLTLCAVAIVIQAVSVAVSIHHHGQYANNALRDASSTYQFIPLLAIIPVLISQRDRMDYFLRIMVVVVLLVSISGIMEYHAIGGFARTDMGIGYVYKGRVSGFFRHPNVLAAFLELGVPLSLALFFREKEVLWKLLAVASVLLGILSILYTFSRGGLLFLSVGMAIVLFWRFRRKLLIPIVLLVLFVVVLLATSDVFERQMAFFTDPMGSLTEPTILHRFISYRGFINQFTDSPLTGVGWGAREFFWGRTLIYSFWEVRHAVSHKNIMDFGGLNSMFLNQAVKGGIISLAAVFTVMAAVVAGALRAFRRGHGIVVIGLVAGLIGFYGHQVVGNQIRWPMANAAFWINMGLLAALGAINPGAEQSVDHPPDEAGG